MFHDVFLEVQQRANTWDKNRSSVRTWLLLRMRSRSIDRIRSPRLSRADPFEGSVAEKQIAPPAPSPQFAREGEQLRAALATLGEEQQRTLTMVYLEGYKLTEVAARLGIPVGTVKSRLANTRQKLRKILGSQRTMS